MVKKEISRKTKDFLEDLQQETTMLDGPNFYGTLIIGSLLDKIVKKKAEINDEIAIPKELKGLLKGINKNCTN